MDQIESVQHVEFNELFSDDTLVPLTSTQLCSLETLLRTQQSRLTHFVRRHLRREDYVDDLIQQTHLTAFKSWAKFRSESKPETWLFGIALNLVKNFRYRDNSYLFQSDDFEEQVGMMQADSICEPEVSLMRQERMDSLKDAINQLPEKMRSVVRLVLLDGLSYQEAAKELDLPVGTVRSRLSRARDMLREDGSCQTETIH